MRERVNRVFGAASALLDRSRRPSVVDAALLLAVAAAAIGLVRLGHRSGGGLRAAVEIDLSVAALPRYALYSLLRGVAAYALSLAFSIGYGYWAAKDRRAERVLVPLLDVLQSIPVLGFMPGLVLALVAAFPRSSVGLELAAILMIFTGQAWNMTFSFYRSVGSVPKELSEVATWGRFSAWQRFRAVELPAAAIGLVWNSMMSMAGGWFFLMVSEAFVLGDRDFRLPGIGAYMSVAVQRGDGGAMVASVVAMALLVVLLDQLVWRPLVAWSERFRLDEGGGALPARSWVYDLLRRSRLGAALRGRRRPPRPPRPAPRAVAAALSVASPAAFLLLLGVLGAGGLRLVHLLRAESVSAWVGVGRETAITLGRVLASVALATLWAVPAGVAIGRSPRLARVLQPAVQVVASFPAPMLFPAVVLGLRAAGVGLGAGSVLLMTLATQWYVLFNVIAGASAVPADLEEASRAYRLGRWQRFRALYLPAVFPYLVTGWVTAAGGAWNASIVSEYVAIGKDTLVAPGIGAAISRAAAEARLADLAAAVTVMAVTVVVFNRLVWRPLGRIAEERFSVQR